MVIFDENTLALGRSKRTWRFAILAARFSEMADRSSNGIRLEIRLRLLSAIVRATHGMAQQSVSIAIHRRCEWVWGSQILAGSERVLEWKQAGDRRSSDQFLHVAYQISSARDRSDSWSFNDDAMNRRCKS